MVPGVRVDLTNLRGTTRFSDLHEDLQKVVESIDTFIHSQIHLADECEQAMPKIGDYLAYIPRDVELDMRLLDAVERALENHADVIEEVKKGKNGDVADARAIFKAIHNLRVPQQFQHSSLWHVPAATSVDPSAAEADGAADLVGYIGKRADETAARLAVFAARTGEVESYLRGMEAETLQQAQRAQFARGRDGARSAEDQVRELAAVLKEFEGGILGIAGRVGALREEVVALELGGNGRRAR
jgi:nucleoporin p58/p45